MAPSDEESKRQKAQHDANPFILFRRFADDQMSTLVNGVSRISSFFKSPSTSPRPSDRDYEEWLLEARESSQGPAREAEEAARIMDVCIKAQKEDQPAFQASASGDDIEPLKCPWPGLSHVCHYDVTGSRFTLAAIARRLPDRILTASLLGEQLPSVPVAYLLYNPYSPVWLEQQPRLCDRGAKWREAFEELLAVQSGQELPPKCSQRMPESSADWVRGMIQLAVCNKEVDTMVSNSAAGKTSEIMEQHPRLLSPFTSLRQPEDSGYEDKGEDEDKNKDKNEDADNDELVDSDDVEITECDIYDTMFCSQQPSLSGTAMVIIAAAMAAARSSAHLQPEPSPTDIDGKKPSILSTLTTTEQTTLQDGSVHTKVVLKKRFSNGREESTETVHHQNAARQTQDAASKSIKDEDARKSDKDKGNNENKSSGWFWS